MQFLFPTFLWGLLALSIPVIIHLFNFRRTKKVMFTNVAFLRAVNTTTSSFRRLKHLLIMAARMAFIAALVLAFAQPFLPSKSGKGVKTGGVASIYVDNSLSMQNELDKKTYLDKAIAKVEELLTAFPQGSQLQLVTNDFSSDEHSVGNAQQIKDRTTTIKFTHTPRTFENILKRQANLASKHNSQGGNQYLWFSDFQKSTSGDLSKLKLDSTSRLFVVPVQAKALQNVFVDSVWMSTPFVREMSANQLTVRLFNTGERAVENLQVKLFIDETQVSSTIASIQSKSSTIASFSFTVKNKGFKKARISFDDTPITFDNDYYFVLNAAPTIKVLHLFGQASTGKYIPTVFDNDSVFAFRSFSASNVDVGQFKTANLVVLEGVQNIDGSIKTALQDFVRAGGSLFVIPSQTPDLQSYNGFMSSFNIRGIQARTITQADFTPLAEPVKTSSFFVDIFDDSTQKELLQMPNQGGVLTWQALGDKLLNFRNSQPFLTTSNAGKGKVYLVASPLDAQFGDFARNALFVPIMYKIAALSVRQEPTAYSFEQNTFTVEVDDIPKTATFKLRKGKLEIIPVQNLNGKQLTIELPKANQLADNQSIESGYYELVLDGKVERLVAFNHDNKESMMDFYSVDELKNIFNGNKNVQIFDKIDDADFVKTFKDQNFGVALWKYFLIAALIFLAIEILLVRLMK
ncbi:MAG: BatA domain-containing protein [Bacteroidota bacterium]